MIGGGIAGCCVALSLAERGAAVTVVEPEAGSRGAATGASAGMLTPQYEHGGPDPLLGLAVEARERWRGFGPRIETLSGRRIGLAWVGALVANATAEEESEAAALAERQRRSGLSAEVVDPGRAAALQPGAGEARSWLWLPDEGRVDTQRLAAALGSAVRAAGAAWRAGTVEAIEASSGAVAAVRLASGDRLPAERVVVAAGAWSGGLEDLPRPLPVRPVRGQLIRYRPVAGGVRRILLRHDGRYVVPREDGTAVAGSTMEEAGWAAAVTDEGLTGIRRAAAELLPALAGATEVEAWAGLRPVAADGLPVLGLDPDLEGLAYATGYGRNGILLAPLGGRLLAGLLLGEVDRPELAPLRPDRF